MVLDSLKDTIFENIQSSNGLFVKHFHDTYTIGLTHAGMFKSVNSHKALLAYKYSTRIINPGDVHCGDSTSWQYTNVYPKVSLLVDIYEQIFLEKKMPIFKSHIIEDMQLYKLLFQFFEAIFTNQEKMKIEIAMLEAFSYLILHYTSEKKEYIPLFDDKKIIQESLSFINDSLSEQIMLEDLANTFSMSKYHFLRVFKKNLGMTPHHYILTQRVHSAKENILQGKSLGESSALAGFSDQSHFIRNFKKIYGYLPKELLNKSNFVLYN